jgi:hypothetical protein
MLNQKRKDGIRQKGNQVFGIKNKELHQNIVSPGLIETDQNAHFPIEIQQQYASLTTIGRRGNRRRCKCNSIFRK